MALWASVEKSIMLFFLASVLFGLMAASAVVTSDVTSDSVNTISTLMKTFFTNKKCNYWSPSCTKPIVRKDWNTLSHKEKSKYIKAVMCLYKNSTLPALHDKYNGTVNRLDDFTAVHSNQSIYIHFVGFFIIWHRYMLGVFEKALRHECSYDGALPYWNTANDLASGQDINLFEIFSNTTGIGGNGLYVDHTGVPNPYNVTGASGGGCVPKGPFGTGSTYKTNIGPSTDTSITNPTCLKRDFAPPTLATCCKQGSVDLVMNQPNFTEFSRYIASGPGFGIGGIHAEGHIAIGGLFGQMSDLFNSPGDPLFYLHHTNLDRIYWQWQMRNPLKRLCEVGGPTVPFDYTLSKGPAVTLDFLVNIDVMGPNKRVGDLLSSVADPFCYEYDRLW